MFFFGKKDFAESMQNRILTKQYFLPENGVARARYWSSWRHHFPVLNRVIRTAGTAVTFPCWIVLSALPAPRIEPNEFLYDPANLRFKSRLPKILGSGFPLRPQGRTRELRPHGLLENVYFWLFANSENTVCCTLATKLRIQNQHLPNKILQW